MNHTDKESLYIVLAALGLAFIFNYLFFERIPGISVFVFTLVFLGSVFVLGKYQKVSLRKSWWLVALPLFFSLMPTFRASGFLTFLNIVTTFGLLMLLSSQLVGTPVFLLKLRDYLTLAILVPFRMLGSAISTVGTIGQVHSNIKNRDVWVRVLKGAIMAVPVLILFSMLFSQADLVFSQFIDGFISINIQERTAQYIVLLLFAFVAGLSFLSYIFFPKEHSPVMPGPDPVSRLTHPGRGIEILVFLGLISILFLIFITFQITYLFGGEANMAGWGFTYAEYARRGFFELLAVATLSLVLLLASEKYAGTEQKKDKRFLTPALILIAEVVVVMFSAWKRLSLYIDAYSLTTLRFYVAGFIILLLVLFILLAIKFIKSKPENFFTFGTLLSVLTFLVIVNLVNPDSFIAKSNINQYNRTGKIDAIYVGRLSADATPQKLELYKKLDGENKIFLQDLLQEQHDILETQNNHWQSFNLSRSRALKLIQEFGK